MEEFKGANVKEFADVASDFCQLLEQASKLRTGELLGQLQQFFPLIYQKSAQLPKPKYCYEEEPRRFVSEENYAVVHDAIRQKLELFFGITQMSPGTRPNRFEVMSFSIAESITDAYEELKNFVKLYEIGIPQAMNDSVWIYRHNFEQNLGLKFIDCLKSLHQILYDKSMEGSRAMQNGDFGQDQNGEEPWYSDDQEEVYEDDE